MKMSKLQKITVTVLVAVIAVGIVSGAVIKNSYNHIAENPDSYSDAEFINLTMNFDDLVSEQEFLNAEVLEYEYKNCPNIFICEMIESKNQYECTKLKCQVDKVIRGEDMSDGDTIVLYDWSNFVASSEYFGDKEHSYYNPMLSMRPLLQAGEKYLVFAEPMDYADEYEKRLDYKAFRMYGTDVNAFCISKNQTRYCSKNVKTYSEISDLEYICFTRKSLDAYNEAKKIILEKYLK
ncbi:MAG: hypothetical protein ACLUFN_05510 [Eubacterium sp.]